jgi:hypothetical protein
MKSQNDSRTVLVVGFILAVWLGMIVLRALTSFGILPPRPIEDWNLTERISALLNGAALAASTVLVSVFVGTKHFALFSRMDKMLTRWPVGLFGVLLIAFASYAVLTKAYQSDRGLLGVSEGASMLIGWFLCFWVFIFNGRKSSEHVPV